MSTTAAEQKGTGRWTAQNALDLGVPVTGIAEATFARSLSALKSEQRSAAADRLGGKSVPGAVSRRRVHRGRAPCALRLEDRGLRPGLRPDADRLRGPNGWGFDLGRVATIWRGGCIIRARFLDRIREAYDEQSPSSRPCSPRRYFADASGARAGPVAPGRRRERRGRCAGTGLLLLARLLRRLRRRAPDRLHSSRDCATTFGAHTYRRTDKEGSFHIAWAAAATSRRFEPGSSRSGG